MAAGADDEILAKIDPLYFMDYAVFTGAVRQYASKTLEVAFKQDPNALRRRLHFLNLVKEEYAAYEDAGAILNALLDYREGKVSAPFISLMKYSPRDVELATMFAGHGVKSGSDLHSALRITEWMPAEWNKEFPDLDLEKALRLACAFLFDDCGTNQKKPGIVAYNKIKHGLLAVPSARAYKAELPDEPAALFATPRELKTEGSNPYVIYVLSATDEQIEQRHAAVEWVQCNLRLFTGLYVTWRYPDDVKARGFGSPTDFFREPSLQDIRHLISEVTRKR